MMRFIQINLHHSKSTTSNLAQLLIELDIDCALIQEPHRKREGDEFVFRDITINYQLIHCLMDDHAYGAVFAVNKTHRKSQH